MKIKQLILQTTCAAFLLSFAATDARALDLAKRIYVNVNAGPALQSDLDIQAVSGVPVAANVPIVTFDIGYRVDANIGVRLTKAISLELDSGYAYNTVKDVIFFYLSGTTPPILPPAITGATGANMSQVPIIMNLMYRIDYDPKWKLDLGVGAGAVLSTFELSNAAGGRTRSSATDFGYQVILGGCRHINDNWDLGLTYKFLGTTEHDWSPIKSGGSFLHALMLTARYSF